MTKKRRKGIKKRYLITVSSIMLAILSVLLLRTFDIDFKHQKTMTEKEIKAIMEFNKDFFEKTIQEKSSQEKAKILRDKFANKISYKQLFDNKEDFKNFKYLPNKDIYGFQLLNNAHVGFYDVHCHFPGGFGDSFVLMVFFIECADNTDSAKTFAHDVVLFVDKIICNLPERFDFSSDENNHNKNDRIKE